MPEEIHGSAPHADVASPSFDPAIEQAAPTAVDAAWTFVGRRQEWYFSFGYNKEYWAPTNIHVTQPSEGNDFTLHSVRGVDTPGWDQRLINTDLFVPQWNFRVGTFLNEARTLGLEFSADHTKWSNIQDQTVGATGVMGGVPIDQDVQLTPAFFDHHLHNGANHVMLNGIYRRPLFGELNESFTAALLVKAGAGLMLPHTVNTILGHDNDVGPKAPGNYFGVHTGWWQFDGWTAGVEAGFRITLWKPFYLEVTDKVAYSELYDLPAYNGTVRHNLWMNEIIVCVGFTIGG